MAKKFVRGITEIRTITNQDFDTNNVNDLLADANDNYIHRRKADKSEEYHCLTDNIKTIKSSNNLLTVTNDNANNTATLTIKSDGTKQNKLTAGTNIEITEDNVINCITTLDIGSKNILRNTSSVKHITGIGDYTQGTWGNASGGDGTIQVQKLTDAPVDTIINGIIVNNNTTGNKDISQANIPVTQGTAYTLSYYVRKAQTSTTNPTSLIRVGFGDFTVLKQQSETISNTTWVRKSLTFTPTTNTIRVQLGQQGGGNIEICGMQIEKGDQATNYVLNTWDIVEKLPQLISSTAMLDIISE